MLQLQPSNGTAFAVLINGIKPAAMQAITQCLQQQVLGLSPLPPVNTEPPGDDKELAPLMGSYVSFDSTITVSKEGERLMMRLTYNIDPLPLEVLELRSVVDLDGNCFAAYTLEEKLWGNVVFLSLSEAGVPRYIFCNGRINSRV